MAKAEQALFFPLTTLVETHGWARELARYLAIAIAIGINDHLGLAVAHNKAQTSFDTYLTLSYLGPVWMMPWQTNPC